MNKMQTNKASFVDLELPFKSLWIGLSFSRNSNINNFSKVTNFRYPIDKTLELEYVAYR